jgi:hypothetical protein
MDSLRGYEWYKTGKLVDNPIDAACQSACSKRF